MIFHDVLIILGFVKVPSTFPVQRVRFFSKDVGPIYFSRLHPRCLPRSPITVLHWNLSIRPRSSVSRNTRYTQMYDT